MHHGEWVGKCVCGGWVWGDDGWGGSVTHPKSRNSAVVFKADLGIPARSIC